MALRYGFFYFLTALLAVKLIAADDHNNVPQEKHRLPFGQHPFRPNNSQVFGSNNSRHARDVTSQEGGSKDTPPQEQASLPVNLFGALPLDNLPFGNLPLGNLPLGNLPLGNLPLGNLPLGNLPLGNQGTPNGNPPTGSRQSRDESSRERRPNNTPPEVIESLPHNRRPSLPFSNLPYDDFPDYYRKRRDISSQESEPQERVDLRSNPLGSLPFGNLIFRNLPVNPRQTRDVSSIERVDLRSNPLGSPPFGNLPVRPRQTRDVALQESEPKDSPPQEGANLRFNPLGSLPFGNLLFRNLPVNSRQTRDVALQENEPNNTPPQERASLPFNPFSFIPFGNIPFFPNISEFIPFGSGNSRDTRDVSSDNSDSNDPAQVGSSFNPFSNLPVANLPFFPNISQFLPFGFGNSRQTRDVSSQESDDAPEEPEEESNQRFFFSLGKRLTTCNYTSTPGLSCVNCFQAQTCYSSNVGVIRRCTFYCNSGRCSFVPGSQCTNSTG